MADMLSRPCHSVFLEIGTIFSVDEGNVFQENLKLLHRYSTNEFAFAFSDLRIRHSGVYTDTYVLITTLIYG